MFARWFRILLIAAAVMSGLPASPQAMARELKIVFSAYTPPYTFEQGDGIVIDIVKAALEPAGYQVVPVYVPIGRGFEMFAEKLVDGTAIIREDSGLTANYSDDFMQYHNVALALKSRDFRISSLDDLKDKSIIAFQNAHKYLGSDFGAAVAGNEQYKEFANQETQTLMLLLGRVDVAVMDESIFRFYREKLVAEGKVGREVDFQTFPLFPPTPYKTAFVDPAIRDAFNQGLAALRRNGGYDAIYQKYIASYFEVRR